MKPLKKNISLSLDEEVIEQVKLLAERYDRSNSQVINIVLKAYLAKNLSIEELRKMDGSLAQYLIEDNDKE